MKGDTAALELLWTRETIGEDGTATTVAVTVSSAEGATELAGTKVSTTGLAQGTSTTTSVMITVSTVDFEAEVPEDAAADETLLERVIAAVAGQTVVYASTVCVTRTTC
jgi:hypothetical protein